MFWGLVVVLAERKLITYVYAVGKQTYSSTWCKTVERGSTNCETMGWRPLCILLNYVILKYVVIKYKASVFVKSN